MRLFIGKVPAIVDELIATLSASGAVEFENRDEAQLDLEAVLKEFVRRERGVVDEAKTRMEREGIGYTGLAKTKARVAKEMGFPTTDETLPYLIDQLLNMLFHSANVAEVFAEDVELRKAITPILRKHMEIEDELDREVRSKIKNLSEGTASFEIEYARVMEQMKRKKGLA